VLELRANIGPGIQAQERLTVLVDKVMDAGDRHQAALVAQSLEAEPLDEHRIADPLCLLGQSLVELELGESLLKYAVREQVPPDDVKPMMSGGVHEFDDVLDFLSAKPSLSSHVMGASVTNQSALSARTQAALRLIPRTVTQTFKTVVIELLDLPRQLVEEIVPTISMDRPGGFDPFEQVLSTGMSWLGAQAARLIGRALAALRLLCPSLTVPDQIEQMLANARKWINNRRGKFEDNLAQMYGISDTARSLDERLLRATQPPANFTAATRALELFEVSFPLAQSWMERIAKLAGYLQVIAQPLPQNVQLVLRGGLVLTHLLIADVSVLHGARVAGIDVPGLRWISSLPAQIRQHLPP
jgi:hypothetical protein